MYENVKNEIELNWTDADITYPFQTSSKTNYCSSTCGVHGLLASEPGYCHLIPFLFNRVFF